MEVGEEYRELDVRGFSSIVGEDVLDVVLSKAPRKVLTRVYNAIDHFEKAKRLSGVDDQMAAVRLIAVEEELVVAVFELIKTQLQSGGKYKPFVDKYKSHQVKLSFYPVLSQIKFILNSMVSESLVGASHADNPDWRTLMVIEDGKAVIRMYLGGTDKYIDHNPMGLIVSLEEQSYQDVLDKMYADLKDQIEEQTGLSVKQFVNQRSDFRNQIMYASDANVAFMVDDVRGLIKSTFPPVVHDLIWVLCIVVSHPIDENSDFLLKQFFDLYRMVLREAKVRNM